MHARHLTSLALTAILVVPRPARPCDCHANPAAAAPQRDPAAVQVRIPDVDLLDQDGARTRFQEVVGDDIAVVTFIFTSCTTICPVISTIFAQLQGDLGDRLGHGVRLVSVTLDPSRDVPARLKAYSEKHHARPGWRWITGAQSDVDQLLKGLGAYAPNFTQHAPMVLIGSRAGGEWVRLNGFPDRQQILAKIAELQARSAALAKRS